jgi:hypothetical protein
MVISTCLLSELLQAIEIGRITVPGQPDKKISKTLSQWCVLMQACHSSSHRSIREKKVVQAGLGKKGNPISKIIRAKRPGGMTQMVE